MRIRTIEEIQKEIDENYSEYKELKRYAGGHYRDGCYVWRNPEYLHKMNEVIRHIKNLKLELNRAKMKEWENRVKKTKNKEEMNMKIYIFTITYNFDGDYVAKKCNTYEEALKMLNDFLEEEVLIVKTESEYEPSVLKWDEDDVTLVYAEGYTTNPIENKDRAFLIEDCAYYRIFEVEI